MRRMERPNQNIYIYIYIAEMKYLAHVTPEPELKYIL